MNLVPGKNKRPEKPAHLRLHSPPLATTELEELVAELPPIVADEEVEEDEDPLPPLKTCCCFNWTRVEELLRMVCDFCLPNQMALPAFRRTSLDPPKNKNVLLIIKSITVRIKIILELLSLKVSNILQCFMRYTTDATANVESTTVFNRHFNHHTIQRARYIPSSTTRK